MKESAITIESLLQIIDKQAKEIYDLKKEIADLKEKLDYLIRQKFAPSSERVTTPEPASDEKTTSDIEVVEDTQEEKIKSTRQKRGNKQTPPDLFEGMIEYILNKTQGNEQKSEAGTDFHKHLENPHRCEFSARHKFEDLIVPRFF